jgi:hypothetical protein
MLDNKGSNNSEITAQLFRGVTLSAQILAGFLSAVLPK